MKKNDKKLKEIVKDSVISAVLMVIPLDLLLFFILKNCMEDDIKIGIWIIIIYTIMVIENYKLKGIINYLLEKKEDQEN